MWCFCVCVPTYPTRADPDTLIGLLLNVKWTTDAYPCICLAYDPFDKTHLCYYPRDEDVKWHAFNKSNKNHWTFEVAVRRMTCSPLQLPVVYVCMCLLKFSWLAASSAAVENKQGPAETGWQEHLRPSLSGLKGRKPGKSIVDYIIRPGGKVGEGATDAEKRMAGATSGHVGGAGGGAGGAGGAGAASGAAKEDGTPSGTSTGTDDAGSADAGTTTTSTATGTDMTDIELEDMTGGGAAGTGGA